METWAYWMFGVMALGMVLKGLCIALVDYPRTSGRGTDAIDIIIVMGFLIWGSCVLW